MFDNRVRPKSAPKQVITYSIGVFRRQLYADSDSARAVDDGGEKTRSGDRHDAHLHKLHATKKTVDWQMHVIHVLQVSTWFANARRRLKKENKMTWSPRNRPGDDDDDDLGDPLDGNDRPSSSLSDASDLAVDGATILKDGRCCCLRRRRHHRRRRQTDGEAVNAKCNAFFAEPKTDSALADDGNRKRACSPTPSNASFEGSPSKKPKIWSIADTINNSSTSTTSSSSSEQSATNAASTTTTAAAADGKRSPPPPSSADLSPASGLSSLSNSAPFAYSTFNPWQQQMAAMAAAAAAKQAPFASPGAFNPFGCGSPMMPAGHPMLGAQLRPEMFAAAMNRLPNSVSFFPPGMLLPPSLHAPVSIVSASTGKLCSMFVSGAYRCVPLIRAGAARPGGGARLI